MGENPDSRLLLLTDTVYPRLLVTYAAPDDFRDPMEIDAEQFIGQKSFKARGKRITTLAVATIEELEPTRFPEETQDTSDDTDSLDATEDPDDPEATNSVVQDTPSDTTPAEPAPEGAIDPLTGQFNLFDD